MAYRQAQLSTTPRPFLSIPPLATITQFQTGHGFTTSGADASSNMNDTSNFVTGTQGATLVSGGAGVTAFLDNKGLTAVNMTGRQYAVVIECDDPTHVLTGTLCFMAGSGASSSTTYQWQLYTAGDIPQNVIQAGRWVYYTLNFADATVNGSPTRTALTDYYVKLQDDNTGNKVTVRVNGIYVLPDTSALAPYARNFPNGVASICFDDGFSSQHDQAKPVLDAAGLTASMFIIWDGIGQSGRLTQAQLLQFQDVSGWDINAHSMTDADHATNFAALSPAELEANITNQQQIMAGQGFQGQGSAYPKGEVSTTAIGLLRKYFQYARGTYNKCLETIPVADMFNLRAVSSISPVSGGSSPTAITTATTGSIDQTVSNHRWLILVFHKIIGNVTSCVNTTGTTYRITYSTSYTPYTVGTSVTLQGFTPSGLNGTYTITAASTTGGFGYVEVTVAANPGTATVQGTALSATTDLDLANFTAIVSKLVSSGVPVMNMADVMKCLYPSPVVPTSGTIDTTATDIQLDGTQAAGASGLLPDAKHVHPAAAAWIPSDSGLLVASCDPYAAQATSGNLTAGTLYLMKVWVRYPMTITRLWWIVTSGGTGASTQSFTGLYSSAGTLLSGSAEISSSLTSAGAKSLTLTTPQALTAGTFVWAAILTNFATTQPILSRVAGSGELARLNETAATYRAATNGTSLTALPGTITPSSNSLAGNILWAGGN